MDLSDALPSAIVILLFAIDFDLHLHFILVQNSLKVIVLTDFASYICPF